MDGRKGFPREGTQAHRLLELTAICGEIPADLVRRLPGGASYKESVVTSLKQAGLLQTYYRDRLRGYRLGRRVKGILLAERPERYSFYLTGNADTNRIRSEMTRRLRLHRTAEIYVAMRNAGVAVFRDEKPPVFAPAASPVFVMEFPAFYGSREIKEMGMETVKIRGSRMTGVLLTQSGIFITYNGGPYRMKWDYRAEQRAQVLLKLILCHRRFPAQYARTEVSGLLFGDGLEPFYQILSGGDGNLRCFFLLDGDYEHFYYLTNDRYGETLLRLLCSPETIAEMNRILMEGWEEKDVDLLIENDAMDQDGNPVLFGYFLDIPRINRFHTALQMQNREGTIVCFDFQKEVLQRFCGGREKLFVLNFEKFERRFFI